MTKELFRKEAVMHRSRALFGDVILRGPLASWIITALLVAIILVIAAMAFFGNAELNDETVPLWQWWLDKL